MNTTMKDVRDQVTYRLGDTNRDSAIWGDAEINRYIRKGLWDLCRNTKAIWDMQHLDLVDGTPTYTLREGWIEVDRVTYNNRRMEPVLRMEAEKLDYLYLEREGEPYGYIMNLDGMNLIRIVRIPAADASEYTTSGTWGILRDPTDITSETVSGTWGLPRRIPYMHPQKGVWGLPRRPYKDQTNVRVEMFRGPEPVPTQDDHRIELPNRYTKYLRFYCLWRCFEREGDGQDLEAAEHYKQRWEMGKMRAINRMNRLMLAKPTIVGGSGLVHASGPPRGPRLPYNYGRVTRTRRR
jgi:hypothetical protein